MVNKKDSKSLCPLGRSTMSSPCRRGNCCNASPCQWAPAQIQQPDVMAHGLAVMAAISDQAMVQWSFVCPFTRRSVCTSRERCNKRKIELGFGPLFSTS
jgi:hypothetical protein